jgi:diguanylate cyclase (GGDEF)-like protein
MKNNFLQNNKTKVYQKIFDNLQNEIYLIDLNGNIVYFNKNNKLSSHFKNDDQPIILENKNIKDISKSFNIKYKLLGDNFIMTIKELLEMNIDMTYEDVFYFHKNNKNDDIFKDLDIFHNSSFNEHLFKDDYITKKSINVISKLSLITIDDIEFILIDNVDVCGEKNIKKLLEIDIILKSHSIGNFGSWVFNKTKNKIQWTDEVYNILNIDNSFLKPTKILDNFFFGSNHDFNKIQMEIKNNLNTIGVYQVQYKIKLPSQNKIKYIQEAGKLYTDKNGDEMIIGIILDITSAIEQEKELNETNILTHNVVDSLQEELIVYDQNNKILLSNYSTNKNFDLPSRINKNKNRLSIINDLSNLNKPSKITKIIKEINDNDFIYHSVNYQSIFDSNNNFLYIIETSTDITDLMNIQNDLINKSNFDNLTKLANRNLFNLTFKKYFEKAKLLNSSLFVLFIDLDEFKFVNDDLGHDIGDTALIKIANILKQQVANNGIAARLGGDEFVCLITSPNTSIDDIKLLASNINKLSNIDIFNHDKSKSIKISTSIGISQFNMKKLNGNTLHYSTSELLKEADQAMYFVKKKMKNNFKFFDEL